MVAFNWLPLPLIPQLRLDHFDWFRQVRCRSFRSVNHFKIVLLSQNSLTAVEHLCERKVNRNNSYFSWLNRVERIESVRRRTCCETTPRKTRQHSNTCSQCNKETKYFFGTNEMNDFVLIVIRSVLISREQLSTFFCSAKTKKTLNKCQFGMKIFISFEQ